MTSVPLKAGSRSVTISNAEKVLFPSDGITKLELARYYETVAPAMLPLVRRRPIMMERFPDGIERAPIVQQRAPQYFPDWIARASVPKRTGGDVTHPTIDNVATLVYLAGQAVITPHVWLSRADRPEYPDQVVFDLDPPGDDIPLAGAAARLLRVILTDAGFAAFLKTSGSKGLHVHVPIRRTRTADVAAGFAVRIAELLVAEDPRRFTTEFSKAKRGGRLFVDVGRNTYGQTAVAPYAVRARSGAPVATPIGWDELRRRNLRFTVRTILAKLRGDGDPWDGMMRHARSLPRSGP